MNMFKRILLSFVGATISALGIACIANSGLGLFGVTAAYLGLSKVTGIPFSVVSMIVEGLMLAYVCYKGKGIGLASILSCTYMSVLIDVFMIILPHHWALVILGPLTMFGWGVTAICELGESATCMLTNVFVEEKGKSVTLVRTILEGAYYAVALLTAREHLSILTLVLLIVTGKLTSMFYNLFKYDPVNAKHSYLIKLNKEVK